MRTKRILVTGMSGLIGSIVRRRLEGKYELVALNRRPVDGVECHQADIADLEGIIPAFDGVHTVVHLAAEASEGSSWQAYKDSNLTGTYNVFEASRISNSVRRVIYASSGSTVRAWENLPPYDAIVSGKYDQVPPSWEKVTHLSMPRPNGIYGCTKLWGEALARMYSDYHGMSALCIRIGHVDKEDRPIATRDFSVWCSHNDIGGLIERCIEAPESLKFDIFYAVSNNKWSYRDMEHARQVLGFEPEDSADDFREVRSS